MVERRKGATETLGAVGELGNGADRRSNAFARSVCRSCCNDSWKRGAKAMIITTRRIVSILAGAYVASQIFPVTKMAYWPSDVWINGTEVTVDRIFPGDKLGLPRPRISYVETVTPLSGIAHNKGQSCQDKREPKVYDKPEIVSWNIGGWAGPCLGDPKGYRWQAVWTWHLGGFSLGPVREDKVVLKKE